MKWFLARYKLGFLLFVLPAVVLFLLYKAAALFVGFSDFLIDWIPHSKLLRITIVLGIAALVPFFFGVILGSDWFKATFEKVLARLPIRVRWLVKALFKMNTLEGNDVVLFRPYDDHNDSTFKIGTVMKTFDRIGPHLFAEKHCLILEGTPPLPSGPQWIKKKSRVIVVSPDFGVKDWLITIFSMGFNFPVDEDQKPPA